jgi:hypothetical protein
LNLDGFVHRIITGGRNVLHQHVVG